MLRQLLVIAGLACSVQLAHAAQAGKVIFVAGKANIADRQVVEGAPVQEGELLSTGADGFIYVKTIDSGLFILRPNTQARIVAYHVDTKNPANTRIKLELISGVARSRSGDAAKVARQNFRFNTPVAAIGVRGTDFTVFTDSNTSRVAVIAGGVVVSGFVGACRPEGSGPCEGASSRELFAAQRGQLLQVQKGEAEPELLEGGPEAPDAISPPASNEPITQVGGGNSGSILIPTGPSLDPQKESAIALPAPSMSPPVVMPPTDVPVVVDNRPEQGVVWGRWQPVLSRAAKINLTQQQLESELIALNGNFALFRSPGKEYLSPDTGKIGFALRESEAFVYADYGANRIVTPGTLSNGQLIVDFGAKQFTTSMDLTILDLMLRPERFPLQAQGSIGKDGRMYGDESKSRIGFINLQGLLSNNNGGTAAYIFNGRLDSLRTVNGVTYWRQQK